MKLEPHPYADIFRLTKTEQRKIDELEEWLDKRAMETVRNQGGYPDIIQHVPGYLIEAGVNDQDHPTLQVWTEEQALQWHAAIIEYLRKPVDEDDDEGPEQRLIDAIYETEPKEIGRRD